MLLGKMLGHFSKLGSGSFSSVYDTRDGLVMKVPIEFDHRGSARFLPLKKRLVVAKSIVLCTGWLREKMGEVIVPVFLGSGGTIRQAKLQETHYWDLPDARKQRVNMKISKIITDAFRIAEHVPFDVGYIDLSHLNFMIDSSDNVLWFDPWTPPDDLGPAHPIQDHNPDRESWK